MTSIFQLSILKKPHERCFKLVLLENLSWRAALFSFFKAAAKWAIFFISDQIEFIFRVLPYSLVPQTPPQNTQGSFNNYVKKKTVVSRKSMYVKCPQLSIRGGRWAKLSKIWSTYLLNDPISSFCFAQCKEVRFASFLSGEFTTMPVINPPERKLEKCISVQ